ncbi:YybH family protein [Massilia sp. GER05]|uniref:YybH family protein n=1 Tax=Massilia sp. GER05 TaxID=3394605 RepID=UPI003F826701
MTPHPLERLIRAADAAITAEDFDALVDFYADDATLVVKPGLNVTGKDNIRAAFERIAAYVQHSLVVGQGRMEVIEGGDTALVIMESTLDYLEAGDNVSVTRRATYVFRREADGRWVCTVDNSYGTALLDYPPK